MLIEALQLLKSKNIIYELHIVGAHKENELAYNNEIASLIEKYDLSKQITCHGWLKQEEILKVYDKCTCFVLPSLQETLPISLAEAMALGKTVVASNVGAVSEMFKEKVEGYLFKRNDVNELVSILESIYTNQEVKRDYSALIKKTAIEKYHPLKNAKMTADFYKDILWQTI
jgi:glycosyltransferase involved in cell wall biosynthesis